LAESSILSTSQLRDIFDKIDRIEIPIVESEDSMESHTSDPVKKLFYIIDSVTRLHHQINSLSHDKKETQSILETKALEIKDLKEEVKQLNRHCEDSKMIKNELSELTSVLEKIIDVLGANNWVVDRQSKGFRELLPQLEKHIIAILSESENSKSKAHELGIKLVGSQKVIDDLTTKVKLLEDSIQDRISQPEIVQERSIYEAPSLPAGSEITEVEEVLYFNSFLSLNFLHDPISGSTGPFQSKCLVVVTLRIELISYQFFVPLYRWVEVIDS
jgi:chromosome segregation ATPase